MTPIIARFRVRVRYPGLSLPELEIIAVHGVGHDGIDHDAVAARGIRIAITPDGPKIPIRRPLARRPSGTAQFPMRTARSFAATRRSTGIDHDAVAARGIRIAITPDVLTDDVADLAIALWTIALVPGGGVSRWSVKRSASITSRAGETAVAR
jgi:lactate dehydrogenase-like 2-hydroxyacid dehydrogenase